MSELPKLKIKLPHSKDTEEICTIDEARFRFKWGSEPFLIIAEGRFICSFDELVECAKDAGLKGKEFIFVEIQPFLAGG